MYRGIRLSAIGVAVSALVALSGCSGSGGAPSDAPASSKAPAGGRLGAGDEIQEARAAAARAIPREGSVTQSSDVDDMSNVTQDFVTVTVTEGPDGLQVSATYNGQRAVDTEHGAAAERSGVEYVLDRPKGTRYFERFDYGDYQAVEFYRSLDTGDLTGVPAGDLWVDVYTDFNGVDIDDTNYLAGGIWVYIPDDGGANDYEFGAFADGAAPYPKSDIVASLTGTATYNGGATGVYSYGTNGGRRNEFFDATATLTADFDTNDPGSVSGRIYDVMVDDEMVDGDPVLMLESALLTADSNFFTGDTSMEFNDEDYTGKWGGQFYNDPDSNVNNDHPGAVAGTFGASTNEGDKSLVGVFGAYNDEQ